jgi:hypothetical protein
MLASQFSITGISRGALKILVTLLCLTGIAIAEDVLSVEFLDYLSEFEGSDGEWIDPMELEMMAQLGDGSGEVAGVIDTKSEVGGDE